MGRTAGPRSPVKIKARLYDALHFFLSIQFFLFSLARPHFCPLPPPFPLCFCEGLRQKAFTPQMVLLLKNQRITRGGGAEGRLLTWLFISISLSGRKNSTDLLLGPLYEPPAVSGAITLRLLSAAELRWVEGGERLPKGSCCPGSVCPYGPHPSFVAGNLEDQL